MRARMMLPQQRGILGGPVRQPQFHGNQPNQFQAIRTSLDNPYGHMVGQQKMQGKLVFFIYSYLMK